MGVSKDRLVPYIIEWGPLMRDMLMRHRDRVSNVVFCADEGITGIKTIQELRSLRFDVIPVVSSGTQAFSGDALYPPEEQARYYSFLDERKDEFPNFLLSGSVGGETHDRRYFRWRFRPEMRARQNQTVISMLRDFSYLGEEKLMFSPMEQDAEREAWRFRGKLEDAHQLGLLLRHGAKAVIFSGFWNLFRNFEDQEDSGYQRDKVSVNKVHGGTGPWIDPRDRSGRLYPDGQGDYPFTYYSEYLTAGVGFYSGIGYPHGARNHNLSRLVEAGYQGAVFCIPQTEEEMLDYLTDVEC